MCVCNVAFAQKRTHRQDSTQMKVIELGDFVITGTRTQKLLKDVPIQTRVITASDIQKTDATNIEDLLQQEMPGIEFSYSMSQHVNMNMSGFAGQSVLFLIDGERIAGETMDNIDFSRLSMSNVERIEIVKGSASALYGSNAAGGVINIITKKETKPWRLSLNGRIGDHGDVRDGVSLGLHKGKLSNTLSFDHTKHDYYRMNGKLDGQRQPEAYTFAQVFAEKTINVKEQLTYTPMEQLKLTARAGYFFRQHDREEALPDRYRDFNGGLRAEWNISGKDHLEAAYSFDQYDKSKFQRIARLDVRNYSNVQNSVKALYNHTFAEGSILTIGGDMMHDYLMNTNLEGKSRTQDTYDIFAQYDWRINDHWEVVGAGRYDYITDGNQSRLTPKLSARYQLGDLNVRASYGMGFRAARLKEKFYDFDMVGIWFIQGNPNLKAETSHNFNLSAEYQYRNYYFTIGGNYNRMHNRITTGVPYNKPTSDDPTQLFLDYINLESMNVLSTEATVQAKWQCGIGAKLSYTYTHEQAPDAAANQYMPTRPHTANCRVEWEHKWHLRNWLKSYMLNIALTGRYYSAVDNKEYINMKLPEQGTRMMHYPAYSMWKLQVMQRLADKVSVNFAIDNLFNYRPDFYYLNAPITTGTNVMIGATVNL